MIRAICTIRTAKGFYGSTFIAEAPTLSDLSKAIVAEMDYQPSEEDGVSITDWTQILIEVDRV